MWGFELLGVDHDVVDLVVFAVGWTVGWALLAAPRDVGSHERGPDRERPAVAVVIPARDEEAALPTLLGPLVAQRRVGDRLVVVDDGSTDATAEVAQRLGADVTTAPGLPDGWLGKPHACHVGASTTEQPILVFLDADVRPSTSLLDDLALELERTPAALVSIQPWHDMATPGERIGALFNVISLMGCGAFTVLGRGRAATVAFGPVLAATREVYDRAGGHSAPTVRAAHVEDIELARSIGTSELFAGRRTTTTFRMYSDGAGATLRGWTRNIAAGFTSAPWWIAIAVVVWLASVIGGPIAAPVVYPLVVLQVAVLGRRAGRIGVGTALLAPLLVVVVAVVVLRSLVLRRRGGTVSWKDRSVSLGDPAR